MVGWARRSSENAKRRREWLASLTPEEKAAALAREEAADKKIIPYIIAFLMAPILICIICEMVYGWHPSNPTYKPTDSKRNNFVAP